MKNLRFLLLLGVGTMLAAVVLDYVDSRRTGAQARVSEPEVIPSDLNSQASRWQWSQSSGDQRKVEIFADSFRQSTETYLFDLEGVELKIYHETGDVYDHVASKTAEFDSRSETLYSEGEVVLSLGIPLDPSQQPAGQPTKIRSSGVTFEAKSGICRTDRPTEYEFEGGWGRSTGAFYDSTNRYFRMESNVYLRRNAESPDDAPLEVHAGKLHYHEDDQRVDLEGGAALHRGNREVQAERANVFLNEGAIQRIEAFRLQGSEEEAERTVNFRADRATLWYNDQQLLERVSGNGNGELSSATETSRTRTWGEQIYLAYAIRPGGTDSELREADVREQAGIEVKPSATTEDAPGDIRRIRAEWLHLTMRAGGEQIDVLETLTRGTLEIVPRSPERWQRRLTAERIQARYGPGNRMEKLEALGDVRVTNTPPPSTGSEVPLLTWSAHLESDFAPGGEATRIRQREDFRFQQGARSGSSGEAEFDLAANQIELRGRARVSDPKGSVKAHRIVLDDRAGTLEAEGDVAATHREKPTPGENSDGQSGIFASSEPVFATAKRMLSNQRTGVIEYRGKARLWQGANRIEADQVDIQRAEKTLSARGNTISVFRAHGETPNAEGQKRPATITVAAESMEYDDGDRRAFYSRDVRLVKEDLTVHANEIEAYLEPTNGDGQAALKRAFARGEVRIVRAASVPSEQRNGFGQEAEYYPREERVILKGAPALLRSGNGNETRGSKLTYSMDEDRLVVVGSDQNRAYSYRSERTDPNQ